MKMDFEFTKEQRELKDRLVQVVNQEIIPKASEYDSCQEVPKELVRLFSHEGLFEFLVPEKYGGKGKDDLRAVEVSIIREELSRGSYQADTLFALQALGSYSIVHSGSEQQKQKYLPGVAKGKILATMALTEREAGSDAANIQTTATRDGDYFVLNGSKYFISNARAAGVIVIFTSTDKSKRAKGVSAFIVEAGTPGLTLKPFRVISPHDIDEVVLTNCKVPKENLLGELGGGFKVAMRTLDVIRTSVGAAAVGLAQSAFDYALAWSKKRIQFGRPIAENQLIKAKLTDMATEIQAARFLVYYAAWLKDQGRRVIMESSMAKYWATEMAQRVVDQALQIHGGYGVMLDYPMERLYRNVRAARIYEGTTEIHKQIVADQLLKRDGGSP